MIEIATKNELVKMLPEKFKEVIEYPEIMVAWAKGLNMAGASEQQIWDNLYVQTCDLGTLEQYEALLHITPDPGDSIEARRVRVLAGLAISIPYTERKIRGIFDALFGSGNYTLTIDYTTETATMVFNTHIDGSIMTFCTSWYGMAPAHMAFTVNEDIHTEIDGDMYFGGYTSSTLYTRIDNRNRGIYSDMYFGGTLSRSEYTNIA